MNARVPDSTFDDGAAATLRIPPHSIHAEQAVLGSLLLDNATWDKVGDLLVAEDFYRYPHRLIFAAISVLCNANRPADLVTVLDQLEKVRNGPEEAGGLAYLGSLANIVPSASNIRRYAEIVRTMALRRRVVSLCDEASTAAFGQELTFEQLLEKVNAGLSALDHGASTNDWHEMDQGVVELLDRIQAQADGTAEQDFTPTGLTLLDDRLDGGMRPGELIVVGARPSMGKSALGLSVAVNVARDIGLPVGFFSMEMPKAQVVNRMMSLQSHIHLSRVKRGERLRDFDWPQITSAVEVLRQLPIHINDQGGLNINQVRARARGLARRRGKLGLLVVDYLGLMAGTDAKAPRTYQLEEATKGLKGLAKELHCPIVLLAQVKRTVEERVDQMPILSDLRDSGSIEQDADIVVFVHREYKAKPGLSDEWKYHAKVSVAKVRDGEPGLMDLMYIGENTRFMDWPTDTPLPTNRVVTKRGSDL